jgi:hypothetical protein
MVLHLEGLLLHRTAGRGRFYLVVGYPVAELRGKVRELNELRACKGPTHLRGKIESSLTGRSGCASAGTVPQPSTCKWILSGYGLIIRAKREYVIGRSSRAPVPVLNLLDRSCESLQ